MTGAERDLAVLALRQLAEGRKRESRQRGVAGPVFQDYRALLRAEAVQAGRLADKLEQDASIGTQLSS